MGILFLKKSHSSILFSELKELVQISKRGKFAFVAFVEIYCRINSCRMHVFVLQQAK